MKNHFLTLIPPTFICPENVSFLRVLHIFKCSYELSRLGMSVTTQGGSGRQYVTGPGRNISKYRLVLLNVFVFGRL